MRVRIAVRADLIVTIFKNLWALRRKNRIDKRDNIPTHGIFHTHGGVDTARHLTVQLIFYATRADGVIGQKVFHVGRIFRI